MKDINSTDLYMHANTHDTEDLYIQMLLHSEHAYLTFYFIAQAITFRFFNRKFYTFYYISRYILHNPTFSR